ncbi:MAG: sulfatase-like hydrolase/transferase [Bacteroidetes bacterium]|mgnify:FL=1|nr:sulfatase-like hydrolase/transferase [Bacteroidota bacterium]
MKNVKLLYLILVLFAGAVIAQTQELPNIIIVYADDLGYGDLSCYNEESAYETPNLDKMARDGVLFTDAHSPSTICSPSRYGLYSGNQIYRSTGRGGGAFDGPGGPSYLKPGTLTIAEMLKKQGCRTGVFGKWHVGLTWFDENNERLKGGFDNSLLIDYEKSTPLIDGPNQRGFDKSFVTPNCPTTDPLYIYIENGMVHKPASMRHKRSTLPNPGGKWRWDNDEGWMSPGYNFTEADLLFYDKTCKFITEHRQKTPHKPFFAVLSTQIAHAPVLPAEQFNGSTKAGPRGDFVWELDVLVGRLMDLIKNLGIDDNTLIVFNADNGAETVHVDWMRQDHMHDASGGWRGMKRDGWEGGHRVPFIVRWPQTFPAGQISDQMINTTDIFATLASVVGYKLDADDARDSYDMLPAMLGIQDEKASIRPYLLTQSFRGEFQIRQENWKYLDHTGSGGNNYENETMKKYALPESEPDAPGQLYNLESDPGETTNLYFTEARKRKELKKLLEKSKENGRSAPAERQPIGIEKIKEINGEGGIVDRWSERKANEWYDKQEWPCGYNYIPANAISYTEMWMPYSFDPNVIDAELALAEDIGFNCLRVVLPFVVWEYNPNLFKSRLNEFLEICDKHGQKVMFTLFDDCAFGSDPKLKNPWYGQQPEVLDGWYASGWTPSPGHDMVRNPETWPRLESYVKDVITAFKDDPRVWVWDLYNEPTNGGLKNTSLPLVKKVYQWGREVNPSQPITIAQWNSNGELNRIIHQNNDITTFHSYSNARVVKELIKSLKILNRPLINTEWLNRSIGSEVLTCLPVFSSENAGCMLWGLVNGKTQTHLHWGWRPGKGDPDIWQHDLFYNDHRPYDKNELDFFKKSVLEHKAAKLEPVLIEPVKNGQAPSDAIILFNRDSLNNFRSVETGGNSEWVVSGEEFTVKPGTKNIETRQKFGDCQLHIEWKTSEKDVIDGKTGQQCSNSGIYLMSKYEIQVLNSYNNKTNPLGQAAAFYGNAAPMVNASLEPEEWQVYDIIFTAPKFNKNEDLLESGYFTLFHNGVLVLNHVEVTEPTASHNGEYSLREPELPLMLQDHKNEVSYRNIWIRKL